MDNAEVQHVVRRTRVRDDVLELAKLIVHLALVVAPTQIGRLVRAGVEYLWKRATSGRRARNSLAHTRQRAEDLRRRLESVNIHQSRAEDWARLVRDVSALIAEYEEFVAWGGWKCFLRKNILRNAQDDAKARLDNLEHREHAEKDLSDSAAEQEWRERHTAQVVDALKAREDDRDERLIAAIEALRSPRSEIESSSSRWHRDAVAG